MLFDLRARGRRRTVQVVYVGLALLFLIGFVGFGVGTGGTGGGGIFESVFGGKEGGAASFAGQVKSAESRVRKHPSEAAAWAKLVEAKWHKASEEQYLGTKGFNDKGKALLTGIVKDWNTYLALKPAKPSLTVANAMLEIYSKGALEQPKSAVEVLQQVIIPSRPPTASLYGELATFAYQDSNTSLGDLASKKAVSLAPANQRTAVKEQLEKVKANPSGEPQNEKFTAKASNGQTYNVKLSPNGKNATAMPTTPSKTAPAKK